MPKVPTVRIDDGAGSYRIINETDFDPDTMTRFGEGGGKPAKPEKTASAGTGDNGGDNGGGDNGGGDNGGGNGKGEGTGTGDNGGEGGGDGGGSEDTRSREDLIARARELGLKGNLAQWKDETLRNRIAEAESKAE